jgi:glycerophosphoryl diester phosphodiesterase
MRSKATSLSPTGKIQILAHRGLVSEFVPENTVKAFADAIAAGADVIETDIQCSLDGVAMVFHDQDLIRLANVKKKVLELSAVELSQLDIGNGKRIPTLEQVLEAFPSVRFNLDIKSTGAIAPTVAAVEKQKAHDRVLISSFSESRRLRALKLFTKPVKTSAGVSKVLKLYIASLLFPKEIFKFFAKGSNALQIPARRGFLRFDSPRFLANAKFANLEVHYWTVNDPKQMQRLAALGATGIVTDHCDIAKATLR